VILVLHEGAGTCDHPDCQSVAAHTVSRGKLDEATPTVEVCAAHLDAVDDDSWPWPYWAYRAAMKRTADAWEVKTMA
jgi:hypothetical protein